MLKMVENISSWSIPLIVLLIPLFGYIKGVKVYESFTEGAKDGVTTVIKIIPFLLAMLVAINIFRASGAMDIMIDLLKPLFNWLDIPEEVVPLLFLRPLSGSGSLSYTTKLMAEHGPDSMIGLMASTIHGSTETTFYIAAVYFGAVGIKKYRYAVTVGLLADLAGFLAAIFICQRLFTR